MAYVQASLKSLAQDRCTAFVQSTIRMGSAVLQYAIYCRYFPKFSGWCTKTVTYCLWELLNSQSETLSVSTVSFDAKPNGNWRVYELF